MNVQTYPRCLGIDGDSGRSNITDSAKPIGTNSQETKEVSPPETILRTPSPRWRELKVHVEDPPYTISFDRGNGFEPVTPETLTYPSNDLCNTCGRFQVFCACLGPFDDIFSVVTP